MQVEFKPNFDDVVKRYQALWAGRMRDQIIVRFQVRDQEAKRDAFMANIPNIEAMFDDYIEYWQPCRRLLDDTLPIVTPNFGTGAVCGCFGAEVSFGDGTSWAEHISDLIDNPERIGYDPNNQYTNLFRDGTKYYCKKIGQIAAAAPPLIESSGDVLYQLLGSRIYTDMLDNAEQIDILLERIAEGIIAFRKDIWQLAPAHEGGIFNNWMNWWVPAGTGLLGDDVFCSCSLDIYKRFGLPVHSSLAQNYRSAFYHLHNLGLHLIPEIVKIPNLICLELSEDPNVALKGLPLLKQVRRQVGPELVVMITVRPGEFLEAMENNALPGNTIYNVCEENYQDIECWDVDRVNHMMEKVWQYRSSQ